MLYKRIVQITALAISSAAIAIFNPDFATAQSLPMSTQPMGNAQSVMIPDFTKISLENLPKIQVTAQLQQQLSQLLSPSTEFLSKPSNNRFLPGMVWLPILKSEPTWQVRRLWLQLS